VPIAQSGISHLLIGATLGMRIAESQYDIDNFFIDRYILVTIYMLKINEI